MKRKDGMGRAGSESEGHGSLCLALPSPSHKLLLASIKGNATIDKVAVSTKADIGRSLIK